MYKVLLFSVSWLFAFSSYVQAGEFDHSQWDALAKANVVNINQGASTQVNYSAFKKQRAELKAYLSALSKVSQKQFDALPKQEQLAFLINAYNAWTVELILTKYPDLESIRDLGSLFSSPWKKEFIPLLGATVSLDHIEHELIRGSRRYNEPRIHFAVNCASVGCPALRAEAYTGEKIEAQLEQQTHQFLADASRNRFEDGELKLSSIFKWYRGDFEEGWRGADSLHGFIALYTKPLNVPASAVQKLKSEDIDIDFLDYDWRLNDTQ